MMNKIIENQLIDELTEQFQRSPMQMNKLHGSDAELIQLSGDPNMRLAITTDSIIEEIAVGLYDDPYLVGWMAVMANMSDLAAVGARPIGILLSEVLPHNYPTASLQRLQQGIQDACVKCATFVLGGDTAMSDRLMLTGTAVGITDSERILSRSGCKPGDAVYVSGPVGRGNAFALSMLAANFSPDLRYGSGVLRYQPIARLSAGQSLPGIASACTDTSDGVLSSLDQLMRLNNVGFEFDENWEYAVDSESGKLAALHGISAWLLLAGQHGEFELLFTVPADHEDDLWEAASKGGWTPLLLGRAIKKPEISLPMCGGRVSIDTALIRNLTYHAGSDIQQYVRELLALDREFRKGEVQYVSQ
jgi:thiamine-monophosphate kinase